MTSDEPKPQGIRTKFRRASIEEVIIVRVRCRRVVVAAVAIAVVMVSTTAASAAGTVEGAGSSFPQLEIEQWRSDVAKKPYSQRINYVSSGSTFGRQQYIQGSVDFGVSDVPFQPDEVQAAAAARPYTYVTISAGGVGFMYNLRDTSGKRIGFSTANGGNGKDLKLTPRSVCRLLSEPNMQWNDPELAADNPDISLPAKRVQPVLRADGSGTGFVVQEYCIATAPDVWSKFVDYVKKTPVLAQGFQGDPFLDGKPSSKWPLFAGTPAFAGDGVASVVATDTSGDSGITYVEAGFAEVRGFPNALVKNAAGVFHYPESGNVNTALKYARQNPDRTVTLDYRTPDGDAYFPISFSYAIVPTSGIDASKGKDLATFLNYAVLQGQSKADTLGYAPLSKEIVDISLNEIVKIPGAPPKPQATSFADGTAQSGATNCGGVIVNPDTGEETPNPCGTKPMMQIDVCYDGNPGQQPTTGRFVYQSQSDVPASGFTVNRPEGTDQGTPFSTLIGDDARRYSSPYSLPAGARDRVLWTIEGVNAAGYRFGPMTARLGSTASQITDANRCNVDSGAPPFDVSEAPLVALMSASAIATLIGAQQLTRRR